MKRFILLCAALLLLVGCSVRPVEPSATPLPSAPTMPTPSPVAPQPTPAVTPLVSAQPDVTEPLPPQPDVWDGTLETLALADFPTALGLVEGPLSLIAQLPESDTWLYGYYGPQKAQGVILRVGGLWQSFDIPFLTPAALLPLMAYGDFDGDLELELGLSLHSGSGTSVSVWDAYIVELGTDAWKVQRLAPADYQSILGEAVMGYYYPETHAVTVTAGDQSVDKALPEDMLATMGDFIGVKFGPMAAFSFEGDTIRASFDGHLDSTGTLQPPLFLVTLTADVVYTGTAFGLTNYALTAIG